MLFRATSVAYGSSQARGRIRATVAYATATATPDTSPSRVCHVHHGPWQCGILNPLSKARDGTCLLMDTSRIGFRWATMGTPRGVILNDFWGKSTYIQSNWHYLSKKLDSQEVRFWGNASLFVPVASNCIFINCAHVEDDKPRNWKAGLFCIGIVPSRWPWVSYLFSLFYCCLLKLWTVFLHRDFQGNSISYIDGNTWKGFRWVEKLWVYSLQIWL